MRDFAVALLADEHEYRDLEIPKQVHRLSFSANEYRDGQTFIKASKNKIQRKTPCRIDGQWHVKNGDGSPLVRHFSFFRNKLLVYPIMTNKHLYTQLKMEN